MLIGCLLICIAYHKPHVFFFVFFFSTWFTGRTTVMVMVVLCIILVFVWSMIIEERERVTCVLV